MENLPIYISLFFVLTTALAVYLLYKISNHSKPVLLLALGWLGVQMAVSLTGFYTNTSQPRFGLLVLPPVVLTIVVFSTNRGRRFIDSLDRKYLTLLHVVRVPVELTLFLLFVFKAVPELMTFEGRNFDILSGVSAVIVYYLGFVKGRMSNKLILLWNFICLGLLFNIVINAVLSVPGPLQQQAFDQPNVGVLYFPFVWLPGFIVPLVLFCHLASIRLLLGAEKRADRLIVKG
jgi:hypothetical protein